VPNFWVGLIVLWKDSIILLLLDVWPLNYYFSIVGSLHLMLGFCARVFFSCTWIDFIKKRLVCLIFVVERHMVFSRCLFIKELNYYIVFFPFTVVHSLFCLCFGI
jgi:hypothetical protein